MRWHWLRLRATAHPTEDPEKVAEALRQVAGLEAESLLPLLQATPVPAHHGGEVVLLDAEIKRQRDLRAAAERLRPHVQDRLARLDAMVDEEGVLYLRFDKQAAFEGRLEPVWHDDTVQARLRVEVHPAGRERVMEALRAWAADGAS